MRVNRWDEVLTTDHTNQVLSLLSARHLAEMQDGTVKSDLTRLLEEQDWPGLCLYELPILSTAKDYGLARQVLGYFQKREDLSIPSVDPKAVAWDAFMKAEDLCAESNALFRSYSQGGFHFRQRVESVLYVAQQKISRILGDVPELSDLRIRFGPGATTQVKKRDASARRKLAQAFCCSEATTRYIQNLLVEVPLWSQLPADDRGVTVPVRIDDARVDFVRKTAKTDRTIAVEPSLTGMVQLGIGEHIAQQLRLEGVDIRDQSLNQRLARIGSLTGALATLDLSSASDTVSCGFVESLFPFQWWDFLRSFRSSYVETPFGRKRLEKFSTMGNGFTFALETLAFFAIAKASAELAGAEGPVSVYGDDIIVPTACFELLVEVLVASGFLVNEKKSFASGPFRESCGKDYYSGISVRPSFVKGALSGADLFILHNFFVREGQPENAAFVRSLLSDELAIYGPDGFGDGHLLGEYPATPHGRERGWGGYTFDTYTYKPNRVFYKRPLSADYVYPSYSIYVGSNAEVDRDLFPQAASRRFPKGSGSVRPDGQLSSHDKKGRLSDTLPGVAGYKRIKIYTLRG